MPNPTQQDVQRNTVAQDRNTEALNKLIGLMGGRASSYNRSDSLGDNGLNKIKNTVANNSISKQFLDQFTRMGMSAKKVGDIYDKLEKETRNQSAAVRKLNVAISDYISKQKSAVKGLEDLYKISNSTKDAMEHYKKNIDQYGDMMKKLNELNVKKADTEKKLLDAQNKLANDRKNKKSTVDAKKQIFEALKELGQISVALKDVNGFVKGLDEATAEIEQFAQVTGSLTKEQVDQLKNYQALNTTSKKYKETLKTLELATEDVDKGLTHVADVLDERASKIGKAFDGLRDSLKKAALDLVTKAPAVAFKDFLNQLKYNVRESDYKNDALMGISESERSQIIGENRTGLRVLGGGDEAAGLRGGGRQIQTAANQYGVTGAAALQLGLQYQRSLMNAGYKGSAGATADQMTVMHNFAKDIGVTDEALKDYTDSLVSNGRQFELNAKYSNLDDDSRRKAVNQEIIARAKLNTQLGLSLENQKALNQAELNRRYGGVAQTIMAGVQGSMALNEYNQNNPNDKLTGDRAARAQEYFTTRSMNDSWSKEQQQQAFTDAQKLRAAPKADLDKAAGKGTRALIGAQIRNTPFSATGYDIGGEGTEAQQFLAQGQAVKGQNVVGNTSYADLQKNIVGQTNNAFLDLTKSMQGLNQEFINGAQILHGAAENPAGAAGKEALNGLGSFGGSLLGSALGRNAGGIARGVGSLASSAAGATMEVGVGGLTAGLVPIVVGVLGAAAVGAAIGTLANHFLEGTKVGNAIGSGLTHTAAFLGVGSAQDALDNNAKAEASGAATDARMAELNKVTSAQKAAVMARGTGNEASSHQLAEQLRSAYKTKYGTDLTGVSVGYSPSPSAGGGLNNMMKTDDALANQAQNDARAAMDKQADSLDKLVKINQDQLDLQKKDSQKDDQDKAAEKGSTWQMYKDHVTQVRQGIATK